MSVTCGRSIISTGYTGFLHQLNWPSRYNWNIVESGAKHNNHDPGLWGSTLFIWFAIITYLWLVFLFCEGLPIIFYLIMIIFHVLWRSTYYFLPDHDYLSCFVEVYILLLPYHDYFFCFVKVYLLFSTWSWLFFLFSWRSTTLSWLVFIFCEGLSIIITLSWLVFLFCEGLSIIITLSWLVCLFCEDLS